MDGAVVPCGCGWCVYTVVPSVGAVRGMGCRYGQRHVDGALAGFEEFGLSAAPADVPGRDVCDVCGGTGVIAESGGVGGVNCGVSLGQGEWRKRCDGCSGLCRIEPERRHSPNLHLTSR